MHVFRMDWIIWSFFASYCNSKEVLSSTLKQYECVLTWGVIVIRQVHRLLIVLPVIISISQATYILHSSVSIWHYARILFCFSLLATQH